MSWQENLSALVSAPLLRAAKYLLAPVALGLLVVLLGHEPVSQACSKLLLKQQTQVGSPLGLDPMALR